MFKKFVAGKKKMSICSAVAGDLIRSPPPTVPPTEAEWASELLGGASYGSFPHMEAVSSIPSCPSDLGSSISNDLAGKCAAMPAAKLESLFAAARPEARAARRQTIKAQLVAAGRAKRAEREA